MLPHTPSISMILPTANRFQSAIYTARAALMQRTPPLPYAPCLQPFFQVWLLRHTTTVANGALYSSLCSQLRNSET